MPPENGRKSELARNLMHALRKGGAGLVKREYGIDVSLDTERRLRELFPNG